MGCHNFSNIEDITRDAGSFDVDEDVLFRKCKACFISVSSLVVVSLILSISLVKNFKQNLDNLL